MPENLHTFLRIHPSDNVLVALKDLPDGTVLNVEGFSLTLREKVAAKHKFTINSIDAGGDIIMYGVLVGKASIDIGQGCGITVNNIVHAADEFKLGDRRTYWEKPDVSAHLHKTFMGIIGPMVQLVPQITGWSSLSYFAKIVILMY